jgi:DNA-directed RNA polymerase subunit D
MDVTILKNERKEGKLSFVLEKSTVAFANSLRRACLEEVPTMAIEEVEVRKNTSVLYDEMLAHRLGLIPIKTDLKSYNLPSECPCGGVGCAQCTLKLSLKAKGPATVYASEIESSDPKSAPVYPKMPIAKLIKGQTLELEMTAKLGKGIEHSKWTPGHIYYKYLPNITISKKGATMLEIAKLCPQSVFEKKGEHIAINDKTLMDCHLCGACEEASKGEIAVEKEVTSFVFYVESFGSLGPEEILVQAATRLEQKFDSFLEAFRKTKEK